MTTSGVVPVSSASESNEVTRVPVITLPPCSPSSASSARVIDSVPPSATGQPTAWAAAVSIMPTEPLRGVFSLLKVWAATPM